MTTWPAGGYRNGESAEEHKDGVYRILRIDKMADVCRTFINIRNP